MLFLYSATGMIGSFAQSALDSTLFAGGASITVEEKIEVPIHSEPEITCPKCGNVFRPGEKSRNLSQEGG